MKTVTGLKTETRIESPAVRIATTPIVLLDERTIDDVVTQAAASERGRARLLLHRGPDELLHEMLIVLPGTSCDVPHMNFRSGKSFAVLRGGMVVMVFSEDGSQVSPYRAEAGSRQVPGMVRLNEPYYHTIIPLTDPVAFIETNMGPFTGNKFAPWAPADMALVEGNRFAETLRGIAREA